MKHTTTTPSDAKLTFRTDSGGTLRLLQFTFTGDEFAKHVDYAWQKPRYKATELFTIDHMLKSNKAPTEGELEKMGKTLIKGHRAWDRETFNQSALAFVTAVAYKWGKGRRNWSRVDKGELVDKLYELIPKVRKSDQAEILEHLCVDHLNISYASKVLRMLCPDRYPVLDDQLVESLGVAKNAAGYRLLCGELDRFRQEFSPEREGVPLRVADIELAVYKMQKKERKASSKAAPSPS